ncbi:MAG: hypothetical protein DWQ02_11350 [Bacteroidetes bacterium]|nr:MAG: hypothetical protein DWQ02_11350 [Bacteroidota bacterium]
MLIQIISAQEAPQRTYLEVNCIKAKNDKVEEVAKKILKPYYETRIKDGNIASWDFYKVRFPNGKDCNCDFYSVKLIDKFENLNYTSEQRMAYFATAFEGKDLESLIQEARAALEIVETNIYENLDAAIKPGSVKPADYGFVNYFEIEAQHENDFREMMSKYGKPFFKGGIEAGNMEGWFFFRRWLPKGTDFGPNYVTVDAWGSFNNIDEFRNNEYELIKKVHPEVDLQAVGNQFDQIAKMTRRELIELVEWVR